MCCWSQCGCDGEVSELRLNVTYDLVFSEEELAVTYNVFYQLSKRIIDFISYANENTEKSVIYK